MRYHRREHELGHIGAFINYYVITFRPNVNKTVWLGLWDRNYRTSTAGGCDGSSRRSETHAQIRRETEKAVCRTSLHRYANTWFEWQTLETNWIRTRIFNIWGLNFDGVFFLSFQLALFFKGSDLALVWREWAEVLEQWQNVTIELSAVRVAASCRSPARDSVPLCNCFSCMPQSFRTVRALLCCFPLIILNTEVLRDSTKTLGT